MGADQRPGLGPAQGVRVVAQGPLLADNLSGEFGHGTGFEGRVGSPS